MSFKLTKEHEGKLLWCIPTQNNISRYGENAKDPLAQGELKLVSDVKRVYVNLDGRKHSFKEYNQSVDRAQYDTKHNSGWLVFEGESAFIEYKNYLQNTDLIREKLQHTYGNLPLTDDQIKRIASILREGE